MTAEGTEGRVSVLTYDGPTDEYATYGQWVQFRYRGGTPFVRRHDAEVLHDEQSDSAWVLCVPQGLAEGGSLLWWEYWLRSGDQEQALQESEPLAEGATAPNNIRIWTPNL